MKMKHSWMFAVALALAVPVAAQGIGPAPALPVPRPAGPGPVVPEPVGPPAIVPGPFGPGPIGPGPIGPGPVEAGPFSPRLIGPGVLPPQPAEGPMIPVNPFLLDFDTPMLAELRLLDMQERGRDREAMLREREREREAQLYAQGYEAASDSRWDRAVTLFSRVVEVGGVKADAALYWKAYSQNRLGQRTEALQTIAELSKSHPGSLYIKQARALEVEVRRDVGQTVRPQDQTDEDIKLLALQALQNTSPEQALPLLEKVLDGTASPRLKERALFVLSQSDSARAREILKNVAKGTASPELQAKAIQYLGVHGGPESRATLAEIYGSSNDVDVKKRILRSFMTAGEKDRLLKAAQGEQNAELRSEAVRQLGAMGAHEELWQLYQRESSIDVKKQILRAMFVGGNADRVIELAKSEKNPDLRREAVRNLGLMGSRKTGDALLQIYGSDRDVEIRKAVINALFIQENAAQLVALARKEDDVAIKKEIVQKLALMRSKVATDYMIELLGK